MIKCLLKCLRQTQCAKVFVLKSGLLRTWGQLSASPFTFISNQSHFPYPGQTSFEQRFLTFFYLSTPFGRV